MTRKRPENALLLSLLALTQLIDDLGVFFCFVVPRYLNPISMEADRQV